MDIGIVLTRQMQLWLAEICNPLITPSLIFIDSCYIWTPRASNPRVIGILMGISTPMKFSSLVHQNQHFFQPIFALPLFDSVAIISW